MAVSSSESLYQKGFGVVNRDFNASVNVSLETVCGRKHTALCLEVVAVQWVWVSNLTWLMLRLFTATFQKERPFFQLKVTCIIFRLVQLSPGMGLCVLVLVPGCDVALPGSGGDAFSCEMPGEESKKFWFFPFSRQSGIQCCCSTLGRFTKMSFGFFTKTDCSILDNSLFAIEKLGIVIKPGGTCVLLSLQCFYFLPAQAELWWFSRAWKTLAQNGRNSRELHQV